MQPLWYIQQNFNTDDMAHLIPALELLDQPYQTFKITPFVYQLPPVEWEGPVIIRGTTTAMKATNLLPNYKLWTNDKFCPFEYKKNYGDLFLNNQSIFCSLEEVESKWFADTLFVRPNSDFKEFTGGIFTKQECMQTLDEIKRRQNHFKDVEADLAISRRMVFKWIIYYTNLHNNNGS